MCNSGYLLSYVDGLGTSYARSFPESTHARFYLTIRLRARDFYVVRDNRELKQATFLSTRTAVGS